MRLDGPSDKQPTRGGTVLRTSFSKANFSLSLYLDIMQLGAERIPSCRESTLTSGWENLMPRR